MQNNQEKRRTFAYLFTKIGVYIHFGIDKMQAFQANIKLNVKQKVIYGT